MTALLILLAPLLQETHELKWDLKEGQSFACAWTLEMGGPGLDVKIDLKGTLAVRKVGPEGVEGDLTVIRYAMKGKMQGEIDMLFEDGVLKRPDPGSPNGKRILPDLLKPLPVKITPRGRYSAVGPHVVQPLFGGQSDFFGAQLPETAVAVGATWQGILESPQSKASGSEPLKATYKLVARTGDTVRITMDHREDIKAAGRVLDTHFEEETTFDVRAGHCVRSRADVAVIDKTDPDRAPPGIPDITTVIRFEMSPARAIEKGAAAPDFSAKNQKGEDVRLSDLLKKRNVLLAVYPKDFTGG
jgi:hypothetical protein